MATTSSSGSTGGSSGSWSGGSFNTGNVYADIERAKQALETARQQASQSAEGSLQYDTAEKYQESITNALVEGAKARANQTALIKDKNIALQQEIIDLEAQRDTAPDDEKDKFNNSINTRKTAYENNQKTLELNNQIHQEMQGVLMEGQADLEAGKPPDQSTMDKAKEYLMWTAIGTAGLKAGVDLFDTWFGDDDAPSMDPVENMKEMTRAYNEVLPEVVDTQRKLQPQITDIESFQRYQELFGDPTAEMFQKYPELAEKFAEARAMDPSLNASGWLQSYMQSNPDDPASQDLRQRISQVGAENRLLSEKLEGASNLYKPEEQGGMGYAEDDFRSAGQKKIMGLADRMMDDGNQNMLRESIYGELAKGGDHSDTYFQAQKDKFLGGMAPSLAKQGGLLSGGAQRFARQMTGDYERTLQNRQSQAMNYEAQQANRLTGLSNLVNANTVSPTSAYGLNTGSQQVGQTYSGTGRQSGSLLADPTTGYGTGMAQQKYATDMLNYANNDTFSGKLGETQVSTQSIMDVIDQYEKQKGGQ